MGTSHKKTAFVWAGLGARNVLTAAIAEPRDVSFEEAEGFGAQNNPDGVARRGFQWRGGAEPSRGQMQLGRLSLPFTSNAVFIGKRSLGGLWTGARNELTKYCGSWAFLARAVSILCVMAVSFPFAAAAQGCALLSQPGAGSDWFPQGGSHPWYSLQLSPTGAVNGVSYYQCQGDPNWYYSSITSGTYTPSTGYAFFSIPTPVCPGRIDDQLTVWGPGCNEGPAIADGYNAAGTHIWHQESLVRRDPTYVGGENTDFLTWNPQPGTQTAARWRVTLYDARIGTAADYTGYQVAESAPATGGPDTCYFPGSIILPQVVLNPAPPAYIFNTHNVDDVVGWPEFLARYYRENIRAPCSTTIPQQMNISFYNTWSPTVAWLGYRQNVLTAGIGICSVASGRDGHAADTVYPCPDCPPDPRITPHVLSGVCNVATCSCDTTCQAGWGTCNITRDVCSTNLNTDPNNCGSCGAPCTAAPPNATPACVGGQCDFQCIPNYTRCGNECFNLTNDAGHCGSCIVACWDHPLGGYPICVNSACDFACNGNLTRCGSACVDTTTDVNHCGNCTTSCPSPPGSIPPPWCANSQCQFTCQAGYSPCNGSCRNFQSDVNNCGFCGNVCGYGEVCRNGNCVCLTGCR